MLGYHFMFIIKVEIVYVPLQNIVNVHASNFEEKKEKERFLDF